MELLNPFQFPGVPLGKDRHQGRRRPCDDRDGDWSDAATSQGTARTASERAPEVGKGPRGPPLRSLQEEAGHTLIPPSGLQNWRRQLSLVLGHAWVVLTHVGFETPHARLEGGPRGRGLAS